MNTDDKDIIVTNLRPPVPTTKFDWSAVRDDYEPGHLIGYGETEREAIIDLKRQELDNTL